MKKIFYPLLLSLTILFLFGSTAGAQSVDCPVVTFPSPAVNNVLTLACGGTCTPISANFPDIRNTNTYIVDSPSYSNHQPFIFASGATQVIVNQDDIYSSSVSLPFTFCFYGVSYTSVAIGANGILAFPGTTFGGGYCAYNIDQFSNYGPLPSTNYDKPAIFGPFHDIDPSKTNTSPRIEYKLIGNSPCRQLVVNYSSIRHYGSSCGSYVSTFQIILYENTNVIEVYIQDKPSCTLWNNGKAILGVQNAGGTLAVTAPGKNATVWGSVGMNKCYRFIPNGSSLLTSVQLIQNGSVVNTATASTQSPGVLTATFPNVCPTTDTSKYTIKANYTACSGSALAAIDSVTIIKRPIPAAPTVVTPVTYCQNDNPAPLSATGTGVLWYTSLTGGSGNSAAPIPSTSVAGTFYWYASQTINGCEGPRATVTVNVNPLPPAPGVASPVNYCIGQTPSPLTATGTNLKWYTVATGGTALPGAPTPSTATAGTYTWYVSQTTNNCEGPRATIVVNVNALPVITVTPGVPIICAGQLVTLTASGANSYTWSPATGLNTTSGATVDASPATTTTYTVTGTNANNCSSNATVTVNVTQLPVVTASSNTPVCTGGTIILTSNSTPASTAYGWTGPNGFTSTLQNPTIPNATVANSGTYYVTATVNSCTSSPAATVDVTVNPTLTANAAAQICPGGSINFGGTTITGAGVYTHTFTSNAGCDSMVMLTVTSSTSITTSFSATICSGSSYTFNGIPHNASGAYSATFTAVNGCDSISTLNLTVNPIPAAPTAISPVTYCQFATPAPLSASGNNLLWYTTATGGTGNTAVPTPSTATPGSTTWYVSQTVGGCESDRTAIVVNVTAQPAVPTVISPKNYCLNATATPLTAGGSNLIWYTSATGGAGNTVAPIPVTTATGSTTYYVSQTVNGCESPRSAITVIINPLPVVTVTPSSATICAGQNVTLNAGGASTYSWSPASGLNTTTGATVTASPTTPTTYTVTGTSAAPASCAATANVTVTVNPVPVISASSNSPVCTGGTLNLSASNVSGATYAWTGPSGFNAATQNPFINSVTASNAGTYSVTATANNCTSVAATTNVVVNPLITGTSSATLCPGSAITWGGMTINGAGTFTHTFTTGGGCDSFATLNVTVNSAIATSITASICQGQSYTFAGVPHTTGGSFSATYVAANGCDSVSTLNLTVNPLPAAPGVISPVTYCQFGTAGALSATGTGILWYTTATGGIGNSTAPIPTTSTPGSTTYYASQTTNGCEGPRAAITVNVTAQPGAPTVSTPVIYCQGAAPAALSAGGSGLLWYANATGGTGNTVAPTPVTTATGSTTYYVSQTVNGCESPRAAITVTVNPTPVVMVTPSTATICAGQNVTLNAAGGNTYSWTPGTGLSNTNTAQVIATPTGTVTYVVTGTNTFNCSSTASATITVNPVPVVTASSNSPICAGQTLNLSATGVSGGTFAWSGPNAFSSTQQNPSVTGVTTSAGGTYTVTATLNNCTSLPSGTSVVVNPTKTSSLNVQLCNASSYSFGGQTITTAGTYTHVFSTTLGCDSTVTLAVTVTTAIATSFGAAICQGQSYVFNGTTYITGGAYTAHFTAVNGCDSASTLNLTVNPLPAAPGVVSPVNYCVGATASALTATGSNLKWYTVATGGTALPGAPTPSTAVAGTYTWYVSQTTNSCEGPRAAIVVNINAIPVVSITPPAATICNGQNVNLTASGATTYTWAGSGLSANTGATVTASPTATTPYTVTGTTNGCSSTASVTVTVNQVPVVTASSNTPVCSGNSINLTATANAGSTFVWSGPNSFSSTQQNPAIANATTSAGGTYTVTATLNGCASIPATTAVVINPTPVISNVVATNPTACAVNDGTITISGLAANGTYTIAYSTNGTPVTPVSFTANGSGNIVITGLGAATYSGFTAAQNGCTSASAGPVTLISPTAPATPTAGANTPLCTGATLNLTASSTTTGVTYSWTGPNSFTSAQQNPSLTNVTVAMAGTYSVIATKAGCVSAAGTVSVVINPTPTTPVTGSNTPVCSGSTLNLTASSNTGATYNWSGPNGFTASTQNPAIANVTAAAAGAYTVTATLAGCTSAAATTNVAVNPTPVISSVTGTPQTNCATPDGTITVGGLTAGAAYTLSYVLNGTTITNTYTANASGNIVLTGIGAGTYTNFIATRNGCSSAPAGPLTIGGPVSVTAPTAGANSPCAGSTLSLTASTVSGATYSWTGPNGFTSTQQNPTINNATVAASGTYSVTATVNGCTSAAGTIAVTVKPIPAAPTASGNTPVCSGSTLSLTAQSSTSGVTYAWTGPNGFTSAVQNPAVSNATTAASGTYSVTASLNGCTSAAGTTTVLVNPTPVITSVTVTPQTSCTAPNGTIIVSGFTPGVTYHLNYDFGGNTFGGNYIASVNGTIVFGNQSAGTYSNFIASYAACNSAPAGPVTIAGPVTVATPVATANTPCSGGTLNLTASTVSGATYSWTGPNGFTSSQQNPTIPNVTVAASGTYSVTATINGCTSPAGTVTVTVNPTPALTSVSSNSPVCVGNTLSLTAQTNTVGNLTYAWTGPNGFTASAQNPSINNATVAASGTYSVTASLNGCTSAAGTTNVTVNPLPAAPGVSNAIYCQGATATVLTANGTGLVWYTTQTGGTPLNGAPLPSTATAGTFTWYVSQTLNGCEGPRAAITVTINVKPAPPVASPASISYCQYENAVALSASGTNLLWYQTPTGGTGNTIAPTPVTTVPGTFHYYVTQSNGSCESDRTMITVVVNPKPAPPAVTPLITYCQGDAAAALSAVGTGLKWYTAQSGGTGISVAPLPNTQVQGTAVYYVSQTVSGCESDRALIKVIVREKPNGIILATHHTLCQEDTLTFYYYGSAPAGSIYNWHFPVGSNVLSGSGQGPFIVAFNTPGNYNVTLQVDDSGCLSGTAVYSVNVRPLPSLHLVAKKDVCVDEKVTIALNQASNNLHGFVWNFDGAQILSSTPDFGGPFVVQWHQPGIYTVTVTANNGECSAKPDTGIITVHELPVASILNKGSFGDICATDTITLQAQAGVGYEYHWSPEPFFDVNGRAVVDARVQFTGTIYLSVNNEWMCSSKDSVNVQTHPCCTVSLPTAFSPNGDGKNDLFRIISPAVQRIANFRVVNRWGQVVWETLRPEAGWNGIFNGVPQEGGVYYYFLRYQCSDGKYYEQKGEVTLLR